MKKFKKRWIFPLLCLLLAAGLTACGTGDSEDLPQEPEESVLIYAALNPVSAETLGFVEKFNETHSDVQIEIHDYSDEGGIERLRVGLVLGKVPDIMEMHYFGKNGPTVGAADRDYHGKWASAENYNVNPGSSTAAQQMNTLCPTGRWRRRAIWRTCGHILKTIRSWGGTGSCKPR